MFLKQILQVKAKKLFSLYRSVKLRMDRLHVSFQTLFFWL